MHEGTRGPQCLGVYVQISINCESLQPAGCKHRTTKFFSPCKCTVCIGTIMQFGQVRALLVSAPEHINFVPGISRRPVNNTPNKAIIEKLGAQLITVSSISNLELMHSSTNIIQYLSLNCGESAEKA